MVLIVDINVAVLLLARLAKMLALFVSALELMLSNQSSLVHQWTLLSKLNDAVSADKDACIPTSQRLLHALKLQPSQLVVLDRYVPYKLASCTSVTLQSSYKVIHAL